MSSRQDLVEPPVSRHPMACPSLDPRSGTKCAQCLSAKMTSYVLGYTQMILWILAFVGLASAPDNVQTAEVILGVIYGIITLGFTVLLLLGLHKDRRSYIKIYLIFCATVTILVIIGTFTILFTEPSKLGFKGFLGNFIMIALNTVSFIAVRSYYLTTYS